MCEGHIAWEMGTGTIRETSNNTPLYFPVFETELREKARIEKDIATRNGNL